MRRVLSHAAVIVALLTFAIPAAAQDDWARPVQGVAEAICAGQKLGVLLVTPSNDETTLAVEALIRQQLLLSGFAQVVMDDTPLGDLTAKSDDEILAAAKSYPVDVVVVVRTFPGADGPTAVIRVESTARDDARSFRLHPGQPPPPWSIAPTPNRAPEDDPAVVAASSATDIGRQQAAMTRMGAIGIVETLRLVSAERTRKVMTFEARPRSPVVHTLEGDVIPWPVAYDLMDRPDLAQSYRRRSVTRTASMAIGALFGAAGIGMLFVGLANQANCGSEAGCGRPVLVIGGISSLAVGAAGIATGLLLRRHRSATPDLETLVRDHNRDLE